MNKAIKVVWICHFSDANIRNCLKYDKCYFKRVLKNNYHFSDFAVWVSNALREFEKYDDIELSVIFPHAGVKKGVQRFRINAIDFYCFRSEDDNFLSFLYNKIHFRDRSYRRNRCLVANIINTIHPDIVHLIGAENPYYSSSLLDVPHEFPTIVSLQTMLSEPDFLANYPMQPRVWSYRSQIEQEVIRKSTFIATTVEKYKDFIVQNIIPTPSFLNLKLAVGQVVNIIPVEKEYDFVYFSMDISKAADYAIEAFAIAVKKYPYLTLNISGYYSDSYKQQLDSRLSELSIQHNVFFTGPLETHDDVIRQIQRSRFAILPLKVDLISGTIREAMACGLPVVTTITPATPSLNESRESVLLSEKGDFQAMALNIFKLVEDPVFANNLKQNGIKTVAEQYSNESLMLMWRKAYNEVYNYVNNKQHFSEDILTTY